MNNRAVLVYACSGCSSAAQMANHFAIRLDRDGAAEMSCIAGVGGGVTGLVRTAQSGRPILALDGCVLKCVSACLSTAGITADTHLLLSDHGVKKRTHADFDAVQAAEVYVRAVLPAALALKVRARAATGDAPSERLATETTDAADAR
jgi:uncharacterized metal-binding protein